MHKQEYKGEQMHWADIMCAIHKAGTTPAQIAKDEDVDRSTVSLVIHGKRTSHKVAYAIAAATGIPTEKMWPGRYLTPPANDNAHGRKEVANG